MRFTITKEHIALLRHLHVYGEGFAKAPFVDSNRPYGNSYIAGDIGEILKWKPLDSEDGRPMLSEKQINKALKMHAEMATVLQIVLVTKGFKPGTYKRRDKCNVLSWMKV